MCTEKQHTLGVDLSINVPEDEEVFVWNSYTMLKSNSYLSKLQHTFIDILKKKMFIKFKMLHEGLTTFISFR